MTMTITTLSILALTLTMILTKTNLRGNSFAMFFSILNLRCFYAVLKVWFREAIARKRQNFIKKRSLKALIVLLVNVVVQ